MRAVLAILLGACLVHAEPLGLNCASCQLPIKGKYLLCSDPGSPDKAPVCEACAQLETSCFLCGIPVKADGLKLEDGRFVCPRDSQTAVFSQPEAIRIFEEVKRNLLRMFSERIAGRQYLLGDALTALDIYWATFSNLIIPLAENVLPALPMIRAAYTCRDDDILGAVSGELLALRQRVYETHLELPVPL